MRTSRRIACLLATTVLAVATLAGCGGDDASDAGDERDAGGPTGAFPLTVDNCGQDVTFDAPPERALFLGSNDVEMVGAAGALDRFQGRAGLFPVDLYDEDTRDELEAIPEIGGGQDANGTVEVSLEQVIALDPDLVIGTEPEGSGVTIASLAELGIPFLVVPSFCPEPPEDPSFDDVYERIEFYGRLFDSDPAETDAAVTALRERVDAVADAAADAPDRTAATLFVFTDATPPSAYGSKSISNALMEEAGFTNVFGDVDERNFETTFEEIIGRDPDVIILLFIDSDDVDSDAASIEQAFASMPGADALTAVQNDDILALNFELTGAPSPLTVDGLEAVADAFGSP